MIFPVLELERTVQVGDKTRLSGVKSFVSPNVLINKVRIQPEATADWVNVTGTREQDWYLDWIYPGDTRTVVVSLEITDGAANVQVITKGLSIVSASDDILYSSDQDLEAIEPKILSYVPEGRSSFLNVHREARNKILEKLSDRGIRASNGQPLTPSVLLQKSEVLNWSRDLTLSLIFKGMILQPDDIFSVKFKYYDKEANARADQAFLTLDVNSDGKADTVEPQGYTSIGYGRLSR